MHLIKSDFKGSQDGVTTDQFTAGSVVPLSRYLADIVVPLGWARPATEAEIAAAADASAPAEASAPADAPAGAIENKAVITDGEATATTKKPRNRSAKP